MRGLIMPLIEPTLEDAQDLFSLSKCEWTTHDFQEVQDALENEV